MEPHSQADAPDAARLALASEGVWTRDGTALVFRHRLGPWRDALLRRMLAMADGTAALLAGLSLALSVNGTTVEALWGAVFAPAWILLAKVHGLYDGDQRTLRHLTVDDVPKVLVWALTGVAALGLPAVVQSMGEWRRMWTEWVKVTP